jgi:hypothetical protein
MVLVVIGLIAGLIFLASEMISAAHVRAQMSQIEKYNTALAVFDLKYNSLPGDIKDPAATTYGFQPRGSYEGEGDGNGYLEGNCSNTPPDYNNLYIGCGEIAVFWEDISEAGLIDTTVFGHDTKGVNYPYMLGPASIAPGLQWCPCVKDWMPAA